MARNHSVSATGSGSFLRWKEEDTYFAGSLRKRCPKWLNLENEWLRLVLSMKPNTVGVSLHSPEDGNKSSFRNVVFFSYLEFWTLDKVHTPSDSKGFLTDIGNRLCGLVIKVPGNTTEMYCVSCEVRTEFIYVMSQIWAWHQDILTGWPSVAMWLWLWLDRLCGLVVRVPGYTTEMYCVSCEVRTEFIYICYVEESRPPLWSSGQSS
jgi:hypothetical protein